MTFIDRLLRGRRIVTKVLLFVVPLVLLMAGVGLLGYHTARVLNGHMTVTRATIGNIGDLQDLQSAFQAFTLQPTEESRDALAAAIDKQKQGIVQLEGLVQGQQDASLLENVRAVAPAMADSVTRLWTTAADRLEISEALEKDLADLKAESEKVDKQIAIVRDNFVEKEEFAKGLLFDSAGYQGIAEKIAKLQAAFDKAGEPDKRAGLIGLYAGAIGKELAKAGESVSDKAMKAMGKVGDLNAKLEAIAANDAPAEMKIAGATPIIAALVPQGDRLAKQAAKNADTAAGRFVSLEKLVAEQKELLGHAQDALRVLDTLGIHIERLRLAPSADTRAVVQERLDAYTAAAAEVSRTGGTNSSMRDFAGRVAPVIASIVAHGDALLGDVEDWTDARTAGKGAIANGMTALNGFVSQAQESGRADSERSGTISVIAMVVGTLMAIAGGLMLVETLRAPLKKITDVMGRLAGGDLSVPIEGRDRGDEIGDMVRSVTVFRDAAVENRRLEQEAEAVRERSRAEMERSSAERARVEAEQRNALDALSAVLGALSRGDLEQGMRTDLSRDFIAMAETYNEAVNALRATLFDVRITADEINAGTGNLAVSADDLARRTEQQAAALEESVNALKHLDEVVRSTATSAASTSSTVEMTASHASRSGEVVEKAVAAMGEISRSSEKIATIIGVIDEIAFQTNLLALNAGVEAARAGEAGRGFAVVAQEVRELAQRCAGAAKEISGLISSSGQQVRNGVALVEETGTALQTMIANIGEVRTLVAKISGEARQQADGIGEVSRAVNDVELITQRNAAMVEENNAEIQGLRDRVTTLSEKIEKFKTGGRQAKTYVEAERWSV
ncbi:methyl-accepting chemotaxis protein [Rhizobium halophytocola]|uniref:Methyl-accepting chemotaxis protein n=1 Tax=Rhizobium halophytocola TaxID=735519 RepID=A0ABS4DZ47_9HYPH|nr:HAMP domain-containing methyl-accepting chemotaxis protein [Rhizobium halophytocola]MBP1850952.1 methyl-accepting chemotaxis protein [Rhizobium halophytocola]